MAWAVHVQCLNRKLEFWPEWYGDPDLAETPSINWRRGIGIGVDEGIERTEHGVHEVVGLRISDWTR